jgi:hypothetical protein
MNPPTSDRTSSDKLVPFRWPSAWTDSSLLRLFAGSAVNCLLFESLAAAKPVADAARGAGMTVLERNSLGAAPLAEVKWDSAAPETVITGLVWPRIKMSAEGAAGVQAGPTGAPWIDSNTWVARLAAVRAPRRPVWLGFELAKDDPVPGEADYNIAIADSAATGARWMVSLDDGLRKGLPAGDAGAQKIWRSMLATLAFFERHRDWTAWMPWGSVGILSSFAGKDEYMGQELLNLSARRNLLYRILDRSRADSQKLDGLRAVLYVDSDSPAPELRAKLEIFARSGGLLIVPHALASEFAAGTPVPCPVTGYEMRPFGKGFLAAAVRDWDDPYFLAADLRSLVGRRHDPVTLFNAQSLWEHFSTAPDGRTALLQLVGFTSRPTESVSMAPAGPWRSAALYTLGSNVPAVLEPVKVDGRPEFRLPAFSYYAALEFRS